ncbi:hypothetical protein B5S28_g227 [[Candida] boidinii]|nr:hypothetical protein B5S28_g227 [[Candida] boidinii]OWB59956.1 hypothetical protein B5S29_g821 [[Candida] boidinii]OWB70520.1 hypothetical protein B5S31_g198 [[Candida] boidinii]
MSNRHKPDSNNYSNSNENSLVNRLEKLYNKRTPSLIAQNYSDSRRINNIDNEEQVPVDYTQVNKFLNSENPSSVDLVSLNNDTKSNNKSDNNKLKLEQERQTVVRPTLIPGFSFHSTFVPTNSMDNNNSDNNKRPLNSSSSNVSNTSSKSTTSFLIGTDPITPKSRPSMLRSQSSSKLFRVYSETDKNHFNYTTGKRIHDDRRYRPYKMAHSSSTGENLVGENNNNHNNNNYDGSISSIRSRYNRIRRTSYNNIKKFKGIEDEYIPNFSFLKPDSKWHTSSENSFASTNDNINNKINNINNKINNNNNKINKDEITITKEPEFKKIDIENQNNLIRSYPLKNNHKSQQSKLTQELVASIPLPAAKSYSTTSESMETTIGNIEQVPIPANIAIPIEIKNNKPSSDNKTIFPKVRTPVSLSALSSVSTESPKERSAPNSASSARKRPARESSSVFSQFHSQVNPISIKTNRRAYSSVSGVADTSSVFEIAGSPEREGDRSLLESAPANFAEMAFTERKKIINDILPDSLKNDTRYKAHFTKLLKAKYSSSSLNSPSLTTNSPAAKFLYGSARQSSVGNSLNNTSFSFASSNGINNSFSDALIPADSNNRGSFVLDHILGPVIGRGAWGTIRLCTKRKDESVDGSNPSSSSDASDENCEIKAIKIVDTKRSVEATQRFKLELYIWSLLEHPNILPLISWKETPNALFALTNRIMGGTLFDLVRYWGPGINQNRNELLDRFVLIKNYCIDVLKAMVYMHGLGIVHGDLKLENCLVDTGNNSKDVSIVLCDFGMSRFYKQGELDINIDRLNMIQDLAKSISESNMFDSYVSYIDPNAASHLNLKKVNQLLKNGENRVNNINDNSKTINNVDQANENGKEENGGLIGISHFRDNFGPSPVSTTLSPAITRSNSRVKFSFDFKDAYAGKHKNSGLGGAITPKEPISDKSNSNIDRRSSISSVASDGEYLTMTTRHKVSPTPSAVPGYAVLVQPRSISGSVSGSVSNPTTASNTNGSKNTSTTNISGGNENSDINTSLNIPDEHIGSLPYAAPEILEPNPTQLDDKTDMWAFGIMLFTLIVGKLPFHHTFEPRLKAMIINNKYDITDLNEILKKLGDPRLEQKYQYLISNCLSKDRNKRLTAEQALAVFENK